VALCGALGALLEQLNVGEVAAAAAAPAVSGVPGALEAVALYRLGAGPGRYCQPRHPPNSRPSFLESNFVTPSHVRPSFLELAVIA